MKPHKAARRRKRPFRTVVHPPPKTWFDRIAPYFFSIGFLISFLMVGYGEACKYVFSHRAIWTYMVQHDIQLPHVWLKKQFERLDLPIREANAESEAQSTEHILYLHTDHMGRVIAATDEQANQTHAATTDPFGKPKDGNPGPTNLGFPGQYYDKETGLYYNYHRAYNPSTGRYVQADPRRGSPPAALDALARQSFLPPYLRKARAALMLANNGASNIVVPEVDTPDPYSYARGNPVNRIDPQGLMSSYDSAVLTAIATGRLADAAQLIENAGGSPAAVEALRRASIFLQTASQAAGQCENVAQQLYNEFRAAGLTPQIVRLTSAGTGRAQNIISVATGQRISETGYHIGVVVEGRVYDAFTGPAGIALSKYATLFDSLGTLSVHVVDK